MFGRKHGNEELNSRVADNNENISESIEMEMPEKGSEIKKKNKKKASDNGTVKKSLFFLPFIVFLLLIVVVINYAIAYSNVVESEYASLSHSVAVVLNSYDTYTYFAEEYNSNDEKTTEVYFGILKKFFLRNGHGRLQMEKASEIVGQDGYVYYLNEDGSVDKSINTPPLSLSAEEINQLIEQGGETLGRVNSYYAEVAGVGQYIIIEWFQNSLEETFSLFNPLSVCRTQMLILDDDDTIMYIKDAEYDSRGGIGALETGDKLEAYGNSTDGNYDYMYFVDKENNEFIGVGAKKEDGHYGGVYIIAFTPINVCFRTCMRSAFYPIILFVFFIILTSVICFSIAGKTRSSKKLFGKHYYTGATKYIISSVIFNILLFMLATSILLILRTYNMNNTEARINLNYLSDAIEQNNEYSELILNYYSSESIDKARIVEWMYECDPQWLNDLTMSKIADSLGVNQIDIYDKNGKAIYSSRGYTEFLLSLDADNAETEAWTIYDDIDKTIAIEDNKHENCYIVAVGLKSANGIIVMHVPCDELYKLLDNFSTEMALINSDFNEAEKVYIDPVNPGVIEIIEDENSFSYMENMFSEISMMNGYSGQEYLAGISYYINTMANDKYVIMSAIKKSILLGRALASVRVTSLSYILVGIIIIYITAIRKKRDDEAEVLTEDEIQLEKDKLNVLLTNRLKIGGVVVILGFSLLIIYENSVSDNAIFDYLFKNESLHELNVYSVTVMALLIIWGLIFSKFQSAFIKFLSNSMGAGAVTYGHMISSLVKAAMWIGIVLFGLYQLGVNPSTLLASAGITSVVIGIGAQSTVSDIISGLFLVFEGHVRVGDWIRVGDFRGTVTAVGLRTTKITLDGDTISVNNSNMNDVVNLSKEESKVIINFQVEYGTDIKKVGDIINSNSERYIRECPLITKAPEFYNVFDMAASGIEVQLFFWTVETYREMAHNAVVRTTYELMQENGIGIPFTTITISNPYPGRE